MCPKHPLKILKGRGGKQASEPFIRDLDQAPGSLISIILKDRVRSNSSILLRAFWEVIRIRIGSGWISLGFVLQNARIRVGSGWISVGFAL